MNKIIKFALCFVISTIMLGCKKDVKTIISDTKAASFVIYTFDEYGSPSGSGSGFFIDSKGTGITNYHVLDGAVKAILKMSDSTEVEIDKVLASDEKWDIAKFSVKNPQDKKFDYLNFANKMPEQGDKVYNISAPMGLEQTVSDGLVSSIRKDSHGDIIQITAPISPGSSGSALLNEDGDVIAVASFFRQGGQNLNFGVVINNDKLAALTDNPFEKKNKSFNSKEDFIILNIPEEHNGNVTLHALEFKKDATIAYLSFTNLDMSYPNMTIWCELGKNDEGFMIKNNSNGRKYYVTSSTIGVNKQNGTDVALASNFKFKVYFPAIKDKLHKIDITYGHTSRGWAFTDIDLDKYREKIVYDVANYTKEYAYSTMHEGDLNTAVGIFTSILDEDPEDVEALNAMGIISAALENMNDANYYFTKAIEAHPNNTLGYLNRSQLYKAQNDIQNALNDMNSAINIDSAQPDNHVKRGMLLAQMEKWEEALKDFNMAIQTEDFKSDAVIYYYRAWCSASTGDFVSARKDVQTAYNLTDDPEFEKTLQELWQKLY
jgi:serine protease Do